MLNVVTWLPPEWTVPLLVYKGLVSVLSVVLLIVHMDRQWDRMNSRAQKARYLCLLGFGVLISGASAEQLGEGLEVLSYRHLGALVMSTALAGVALYSIRSEGKGR